MAQLYFVYASMNAGKSADLLKASYNYTERGMHTLIMKPSVDTRDSSTEVVSRIGLRADASPIDPEMDILEYFKFRNAQRPLSCVFIDEAQFLEPEQVLQLCQIVDQYDVPVMAYGLRTDFRGELFAGSKALMSCADKLMELKGMCHCGRKATFVARIDAEGNAVQDGPVVEIGSEDRYVSLCRKHWAQLQGIY